jgi:putative methionine-R-sulfoxide reductase with GAF domain
MNQIDSKGKISAILEIKKKVHLLNVVIPFIVFTLLAVIFRYLFQPLSDYLDFLPPISISLIIGIVCFLALLGLILANMLTRQIFRIIEDYSGRLDRILAITRDLREEQYGDILLDKIMDHSLTITQSDAGSILLVDDDDRLTFKIIKGEKAADLIGTSIEKGQGIAGWVAQNGTPLRIPHASKDKRFNPDIDALTGYKTDSILCLPLMAKNTIVGVLELLNKTGGYSFRKRDEEVITYLADQAALSIVSTKFLEDQRNYEIHLTEMLIGSIDFHITEKKGHARRVARYANIMASALNMSEEEKKHLYFASLLHDIGFLKIHADDAFKKEEHIKHPVIGYEMIKPISFYGEIAPYILHHHERYDGQGYPGKLKGEDIPFMARIIFIAEAFDAMISEVSYKVPISFEDAQEELKRNAGTQFDPKLVDLFLDNITPDHLE